MAVYKYTVTAIGWPQHSALTLRLQPARKIESVGLSPGSCAIVIIAMAREEELKVTA